MVRRPIALLVAGGLTSLALIVAGMIPTDLVAANKPGNANKPSKGNKRPIRNPKFDPTAEKVDLFEAMDAGQVDAKLVLRNAMGGTVLLENKTDKPLTVKVPDAVVGVPILGQFGGGGGGFGGGGMGGGGMGGGGMGGGGGGQAAGGGMGGGGMGGGGMGGGGMGGGAFSIPAEKVVSLSFNSVCLEHGKPEPTSASRYKLIPVSRFNSDPVLFQLLTTVGTGKVDSQAAQAAAWYLTDKMSFQQLAAKTDEPLGGAAPTPYFSEEQLLLARELLNVAADRATEEKPTDRESSDAESLDTEPRSSRVRKN